MERTCKTLTLEEVIEINRLVIDNYGGLFVAETNNVANENSLRYIIDTIDETVFGEERYPTSFLKVAALGWNIIANTSVS